MVTTFQNHELFLFNCTWTYHSVSKQVSMLNYSLDIRVPAGKHSPFITLFLQHRKRWKLNKYFQLEFSSRYFTWAYHPMDGGRCLGITANVSPRYMCAPAHLWASHHWSLFLLLQATMSDIACLSTDASLWELTTKLRWSSHDFCLVVTNFQVWAIMQAQLDTLSLVMVWWDAKKPQWDMAFHLIMLNIAAEPRGSLASLLYGCIHAKPATHL